MKTKLWKSLTSMALALAMLLAVALSTAAAQQTDQPQYRTFRGTWLQVQAQLDYFSSVFASVNTTANSVVVGGDVTTFDDRTVTLTLTAERSLNNSTGWSAVPGKTWTDSFSTRGMLPEYMTRTCQSPASGYFYRSNLSAYCYSSGGVLLEGVQVASPGKYYRAGATSAELMSSVAEEPIYEVIQLIN